MSTRCLIGIKNQDNTITFIYSHNSDYPDKQLKLLNSSYGCIQRVNDLLSLGDLSYVTECIYDIHAYKEDKDENWEDIKPKTVKNLFEFKKQMPNYGADYIYLFTDTGWIYETD